MTLDPRLLEILICPACRGDIRTVNDGEGIECRECGRVYPVRGGIPRMMVEEASPPTAPKKSER